MSRLSDALERVRDIVDDVPRLPTAALSLGDLRDAAASIGGGVTVAHVRAVSIVEAGPHGPFLPTGHPVVLFERHLFHRETNGRWDREDPGLSSATAGGYGKVSAQPGRLARARLLDDAAAVRSTSWGAWQILGSNYRAAGFGDLAAFERGMRRSARDQLLAFADLIRAWDLAGALAAGDWRAFARRYNGPAYAQHGYHVRLAEAFAAAVADLEAAA